MVGIAVVPEAFKLSSSPGSRLEPNPSYIDLVSVCTEVLGAFRGSATFIATVDYDTFNCYNNPKQPFEHDDQDLYR